MQYVLSLLFLNVTDTRLQDGQMACRFSSCFKSKQPKFEPRSVLSRLAGAAIDCWRVASQFFRQ